MPSKDDWQDLIDFLGGAESAGIKMREPGEEHWHYLLSNQPISTNESGFLALPAAERGSFYPNSNYYSYAAFWSSTDYDSDRAWKCRLASEGAYRDSLSGKIGGLSVRLVKDQ